MRGHVMAVLFLLCGTGTGAGRADAQTARHTAPPGANPRDIREVFLALPVPAAADRGPFLARFGDRIATRALRERALELAGDPGSLATIDPRNGYLEMCVEDPEYGSCLGRLTLTYFNQRNGDRLVVMQVPEEQSSRMEDYFWRLSGGRFTPVEARTVLPDLTWSDYWGDQPLPAGLSPRFFREWGALSLGWPRQGTEVPATVFPLYSGVPERDDRFNELLNSLRFTSVTLIWDRERGVFTKGRRIPYDPAEQGDDHDHH